ncbi:olfactory receptor 11L1-like [Ascaphus truei]|uniref:olfactory receptor 11L1-like n=1 Tax=Ascaphus truei TaxID=8439 RepID=UPI003F5A5652
MFGKNDTAITEVLLLGFSGLHSFKMLLFFLLLVIYIGTVAGNVLIIVLVSTSHQLHSPMYLFLSHLSLSDVLLTTTIVPNMLLVILEEGSIMSFGSCITQLFIFGASSNPQCCLLTVMSYDRYLAICDPLRYTSIMNLRLCITLVICSWLVGFIIMILLCTLISRSGFCRSNVIDHFFCDLAPLAELSCSDTSTVQLVAFLIAAPETLLQIMFIITTYVYISLAILRIPSTTMRQKAFSTCSSHLAVVGTYFGTLIAIYVVPSRGHTFNLNKVLSLLYTVMTPLSNPIIYSLRNQEIRTALQKRFHKHLNPSVRSL